MEVAYTPNFVRMFKSLPPDTQEEAHEKIELFRNIANHARLKVHKLRGRLSGRYSFSVNYSTRIVFRYSQSPKTALLLAIGSHEVYT